MTSPIKPGGAGLPLSPPSENKPGQGEAQKVINEAQADLWQRLSALMRSADLRSAATQLDALAKGIPQPQGAPTFTPEEALQLMAQLTEGALGPTQKEVEGKPAAGKDLPQGFTETAESAAVLKTLGRADGPLAGRALDRSAQPVGPSSPGPQSSPQVPHPIDPGAGTVFAPFFRWIPRRRTWKDFRRWLERKLLKRDLEASQNELFEIIEEEEE